MITVEVGQVYSSADDTVTVTYVTSDYGNVYVRFMSEKFGKEFECDQALFNKNFTVVVSEVIEVPEVPEAAVVA